MTRFSRSSGAVDVGIHTPLLYFGGVAGKLCCLVSLRVFYRCSFKFEHQLLAQVASYDTVQHTPLERIGRLHRLL